MRRKSLHQKYDHVLRLARRNALNGSPTAYRMYIWLCDNQRKFVPENSTCPLARNPTKSYSHKLFRDMGWKQG